MTEINKKITYKINTNYFANIPDLEDQEEKSIIILDLKTNDANKISFDDKGKTTYKFESNEEAMRLRLDFDKKIDALRKRDLDYIYSLKISDHRKASETMIDIKRLP